MHDHGLIDTETDLRVLLDAIAGSPWVAVDTEFMREKTYFPQLCLIQLATPDHIACIDPLAFGDLGPLKALLHDPAVLKVFHACRQDLEIFLRLMDGSLPEPIFDSQIAAMVCGFGEEVAYETLVNRLAKAKLDKSSRFTDWSRRPLSEAQLAYAAGDVRFLLPARDRLETMLRREQRWDLAQRCFGCLPVMAELDRNRFHLLFEHSSGGNR
jgi:ribonuclease D